MGMIRSTRINFKTTSEVHGKIRLLAFLQGWTVSRTAHEIAKCGLPVLVGELPDTERQTWEQMLEGLSVEAN